MLDPNEVPLSLPEDTMAELTNMAVVEHPTESRRAVTLRALRGYVDGLAAGKGPRQAALDAGTSLGELKRGGKKVRERLEALTEDYGASADELARLVKMTWTQLALEALDPKVKLAALHELSSIPEVGLKAGRGNPTREPLSAETLALLGGEE